MLAKGQTHNQSCFLKFEVLFVKMSISQVDILLSGLSKIKMYVFFKTKGMQVTVNFRMVTHIKEWHMWAADSQRDITP